ncbi:unnamed protein product [Closterium sp. NIES-54]
MQTVGLHQHVDSGAARGAVSGGAASGGTEPGGAESEGAETGGAEPGGVETGGAEPGGAEPEGVEPGGVASEGAESGGAEPPGAALSGGSGGASSRLSPQQLREWFVRHARLRSGATGTGGAGAARAGGAGVAAGAGVTGGTAATGPGDARTRGTGAAGTGGVEGAGAGDPTESEATGAGGSGTGGAGAGGAGVGGTGAGGTGVGDTGAGGAGAGGARAVAPDGAPASPLPAPSPYTEQSGGLTERREPASCPVSPVCTARHVPHSRPPPIPGTHAMTLRPSSSDHAHAASQTVSRLLATAVTDPSFESATASALVAELLDFAAAGRLDYATALVAKSESASPPSLAGECALGTNVLEDMQEDFGCLIAAVTRFASMLLALDAPDIPTPRSYAEAITVYVLRQAPRDWHDTLRTTLAALGFAPSTADPSLFLRTNTSLPPFYVLVYLGLQITRDRARCSITLTQSHMVHQVLQRFGFQFSSPQPTPLSTGHSLSAPPSDESVEPSGPCPELVGCLMYLMTCTRSDLAYPLSLLARYVAPSRHRKVHWDAAKRVLRYLCSTSGMGLVLGGRGPVVLTGHADASWVGDSATQQSSQGYTFSLGSDSISWRSTRSSSVLSSNCEAEIYAGAMAAQELRWLTYLLSDLGEQPRSPPVLYVDNKAMIALCQEHRLEHRTKHIALRYFLAQELQQRGQLRLAYVATRANTADIFTKALPPSDHQCFSTVLGLVPTLPHLLTA